MSSVASKVTPPPNSQATAVLIWDDLMFEHAWFVYCLTTVSWTSERECLTVATGSFCMSSLDILGWSYTLPGEMIPNQPDRKFSQRPGPQRLADAVELAHFDGTKWVCCDWDHELFKHENHSKKWYKACFLSNFNDRIALERSARQPKLAKVGCIVSKSLRFFGNDF